METYMKKTTLLELALNRCESTSELGKFAGLVYEL